jgi:hypothetical protein
MELAPLHLELTPVEIAGLTLSSSSRRVFFLVKVPQPEALPSYPYATALQIEEIKAAAQVQINERFFERVRHARMGWRASTMYVTDVTDNVALFYINYIRP